MANMKKFPREIRDVVKDWFTFKAAAERPDKGGGMELVEILELGCVDQELSAHFHVPSREDPRQLDPALLARRIRGDQTEFGLESVPEDLPLERATALLFAHRHGNSLEESRALLERYLTLLDDGYRPLLGRFKDVVG